MERSGPSVLGLALFLAACGGEGVGGPRHVVLVVLDSVRADHLGTYGYPRATTPRLDALARESVLFERAFAGSSDCGQALATLWTGRLPSSGGSTGLETAPHPALATLPRLLARAGLRTALVSNLTRLRGRTFTRGFDDIEVDSVAGRWDGATVSAKALELVDQAAGAPFFLAACYADAAEPHLPPPELRRRIEVPQVEELLTLDALRGAAGELPADIRSSPGFLDLVARYDAELAGLDHALGLLVDGLTSRGLLDETLLVVTASHGSEFLEHGFAGSGWTLYEEVLRVPLIVHAPRFLAHERVAAPVSLADLVPTLERVFALAPREDPLDGEPFLAAESGGLAVRARREALLAELVLPGLAFQRASITREWTRIDTLAWTPPGERLARLAEHQDWLERVRSGAVPRPDPWGAPVRSELYDLAADPGQTNDLAEAEPARLASLARLLEQYRESCRAHGLETPELAPRTGEPRATDSDQLQALGYM